jgi:lipopolysaccharide export system ATP-binding protein
MNTFEAVRLSKRFGKRSILHDVSLSLKSGQMIGLLGPNGSGKTTCFSILSGLINPDQGSIALNGVEITSLPLYQRARLGITYLPQNHSIFRGLSVIENILAILEYQEQDPQIRKNRADSLLEAFHLDHLKDFSALHLSGGEKRRLEIARCLCLQPQFLFLDEPLAGVDPIAIRDIQSLLIRLARDQSIGILMTDHNVRETLSLVDFAYVIADGHILAQGTPQSLVQQDEVKRIYLGKHFSEESHPGFIKKLD